jgi:pyridinium-3,5-biscarboxylic acid mononucleotide sulfurtransferase
MKSKLEKLEEWYSNHPRLLVAFSGGVDSCLAAYLGRRFLGKENLIACISTSPGLKRRDLKLARRFCDENQITLREMITDELDVPGYATNPINRCFFCKSTLYTHLNRLIDEEFVGFEIINGNNHDDLGDYRPGLEAATKYRSLSPFIDCQVTKPEIRSLAKEMGLETWDKPASPCLSSRFPYGEEITREKLGRVEAAEEVLLDLGIPEVRVRSFGEKAKIEVPVAYLEHLNRVYETASSSLIELGFAACEIDDEGLVSGKMNRGVVHV